MTVTVRDVARAAGVSQATAARALGEYGYASRTQARMRVHASARGARIHAQRGGPGAGVAGHPDDRPGRRRHREPVLRRRRPRPVRCGRDAQGYTVLLTNADEDPERGAAGDAWRCARGRSTAWWSCRRPAPGRDAIRWTARRSCSSTAPCAASRPTRSWCDNAPAPARAVDHLIALGHRRIGIVSDSPQISLLGRADRRLPAGAARERACWTIGWSRSAAPPRPTAWWRRVRCSIAPTGRPRSSRPTTS